MQKIYHTDWFSSEMLMIKESYNVIGLDIFWSVNWNFMYHIKGKALNQSPIMNYFLTIPQTNQRHPSKSMQVWVSLDSPGHTQPRVMVSAADFL